MARLAGKVAFITGAGSGIGRAAAVLFAKEGAEVVVADINPAGAEETVQQATAAGGKAIFIRTDVTEPESFQNAIRRTVEHFGKLNVLYNNAGGATANDNNVVDVPIEEFWRTIKLDLFGTFLGCRFAIPEMIKTGGGSVINAASIVALKGFPVSPCYTTAKGGIAAMTRQLAVAYAAQHVRVNAIAPCITKTERVLAHVKNRPAVTEMAKKHLLGLADPIDIANGALFLASDESRMMTGQVMPVDSAVSIS